MSSTSSPFGQNEWLVEEMYRKFREDPSSVDPSWHEFLTGYSPEATTAAPAGGNGQSGKGQATATAAAPAPAVAPPPQPAPAPPAPSSDPEPAPPPAPPATAATVPVAESVAVPAADETQVLRGASAAVVKNMNVSLEIPTATSVRAIPAKLMIDNRVVANNHLKRTRGGKISFTHLLGYAIVQGVKKFPNMNRHFAEIDGCLLYTSPSPRDGLLSRMPSSA